MDANIHQVVRFALKYYKCIGNPLSRTAVRLLEQGKWDELQELSPLLPSLYPNHQEYYDDALVCALLSKFVVPGGLERAKRAAKDKFFAVEAKNCLTNARLSRFVDFQGPFEDPADGAVIAFIVQWRKIVKDVLGSLPKQLTPRFTGGSTLTDKGCETTIPDKMSSQPTLYPAGFDIWDHSVRGTILERQIPSTRRHTGRYGARPVAVLANRFFSVPKKSKEERGACVEASGSLMLQRAVGEEILERYNRYYKVDMKRLPEVHQRLAREGSVDGLIATVDLRTASDCGVTNLMKVILPQDWFCLLNSLRAPYTEVDGKAYKLHKFSSMGNGFTFELETLVFRTLAQAVGCEWASVFGDDCIIPVGQYRDFIAALRYFGYEPNVDKTFSEGPFRESCGGDYWGGQAVRPYYLDNNLDEPQQWLSAANAVRRIDPHLDRFAAVWNMCVYDNLPTAWRNPGPESLGDTVLHTEYEPTYIEGTPYVKAMTPVSRRLGLWQWHPDVSLSAASLTSRSTTSRRDDVSGFRSRWLPIYGIDDVEATRIAVKRLWKPRPPYVKDRREAYRTWRGNST